MPDFLANREIVVRLENVYAARLPHDNPALPPDQVRCSFAVEVTRGASAGNGVVRSAA